VPRHIPNTRGPVPVRSFEGNVRETPVDYTRAVTDTAWTGDDSRYSARVLADGASAYWRLDETSGNFIDEVASLAATPGSGVTRNQPGLLSRDTNAAATFDGTSNAGANASYTSALALADNFTIEVWVKRGRTGVQEQLVIQTGSGGFSLRFDSNNTIALRKAGTGYSAQSTATVTDTTSRHHIVAAKNGSDVRLYLDGVDVTATITPQTLVDTGGSVEIGNDNIGSSTGPFQGTLDEVSLYKSALSAKKIVEHYVLGTNLDDEVTYVTSGGAFTRDVADSAPASETVTRSVAFVRAVGDTASASDSPTRTTAANRAISQAAAATEAISRVVSNKRAISDSAPATESLASTRGFIRSLYEPSYSGAVLADSPAGYWRLDETTGTIAENAATPGTNTGSYGNGGAVGQPSLLANDEGKSWGANGAANGGVTLDGGTTWFTANFTFEGWFYATSGPSQQYLWATTTNAGPYLRLENGTDVKFFPGGTGPGTTETWTSSWPGLNQPVHVMLTFNTTSHDVKLYINGAAKVAASSGTTTGNVTAGWASTNSIQLGRSNSGLVWTDRFDEVAIYSSVLTSTDASEHYRAGAVQTTESVSRIVTKLVDISQTASASDAVTRTTAASRAPTETAGATDSLARVTAASRAIAQAAAATESLTRAASYPRAISQAAAATDAVTRSTSAARAIADTAPAAESLARVAQAARAIAQAAAATESLTRAASASRDISQSAPATESTSRSEALARAISESAAVSEAISRAVAVARAIAQAAAATETVSRTTADSRATTESAPSTESVSRLVSPLRDVADFAPAGQLVTRSFAGDRSVSDSAPTSENVFATNDQVAYLFESAEAVEQLFRTATYGRFISQAAAAVDTVSWPSPTGTRPPLVALELNAPSKKALFTDTRAKAARELNAHIQVARAVEVSMRATEPEFLPKSARAARDALLEQARALLDGDLLGASAAAHGTTEAEEE
jgi:hypothetical protein